MTVLPVAVQRAIDELIAKWREQARIAGDLALRLARTNFIPGDGARIVAETTYKEVSNCADELEVALTRVAQIALSASTTEPPSDIAHRLAFLADTLQTRWTTQHSADDSARPAFELDIPTREIDAVITVMREAAAALRLPRVEEIAGAAPEGS